MPARCVKSPGEDRNIEGEIAIVTKTKQALSELFAGCQVRTSLGDCMSVGFLRNMKGVGSNDGPVAEVREGSSRQESFSD